MSDTIIRSIFESRLATWASQRATPLKVAFENFSFVPPNTAYLAAYLLPANTTSDDLKGSHRGYQGVFQVNVVTPMGIGSGQAAGIADEIAALFPVNLRLSKAGFTVQTMTPVSRSTSSQDATNYSLPVSFSYRADTV